VLDVGANIGFHPVHLAHLVGEQGKVYAFEPNPELHPILQRTIDAAGRTELYRVALADTDTPATFYVPDDDHSCGSLADFSGLPSHKLVIERRRLDDLIASGTVRHPDFIKCDVEGWEHAVFRGTRETLDREDAPVILFEDVEKTTRAAGVPQTASRDFLASLARPGYRFYDVLRDGGGLQPYAEQRPESADALAVPAHRVL
jgi:FkbM family methyltransferase